jgi:hypothetical protein
MFNGPYMITDVSHSIQPGSFQTIFNGVRQGIFDLPAIDSFLQSINQNLLTKLEELLKINKEQVTVSGTTNTIKASQLPQKADNTLDTTNSCTSKVILPEYTNANPAYTAVNGTLTKVTPNDLAAVLKRLLPNNPDLQSIIYCISYLRTFQKDANTEVGTFNGWNNNLSTISLDMSYGGQITQLQKTYSCINLKSNPSTSISQPVAHFASLDDYVNFMSGRLTQRVPQILDIGLAKYYVCFWPKANISPEYYDTHIGEFKQTKETLYKALSSAVKAGLTNVDKSVQLKDAIKKTEANGKTPGVTPTPTPLPVLSGLTCPPPVISTFTPLSGNTGTIIQINGRNFASVSAVTFSSQVTPIQPQQIFSKVLAKDITFLNDGTLRLSIPQLGTGTQKTEVKVVVVGEYGSFSPAKLFTYDPAIVASTASSPGGYLNPIASNTAPPPSATSNVNLTNKNSNPQSTGAPTMISTETKITRNLTGTLNVKMDPNTPPATMSTAVLMEVSVYRNTLENNVIKKTLIQTATSVRDNLVTNNEFNVTYSDVANLLINTPIPPFNTTPINVRDTVLLQFTLTAYPVDKVKYPKSTTQSFNFTFKEA